MKKQTLCVLTAIACATAAGAATNYDLLGRKASKMNSPMVYKNVDYKAIKKSSLDENGPLAALSPAVSYEGRFTESLYNHTRGEDGLPTERYVYYKYHYNTACYGTGNHFNFRWNYAPYHNSFHTQIKFNWYPSPDSIAAVKTATGYDVAFSTFDYGRFFVYGHIGASYNASESPNFTHYDEIPYSQSGKPFPYSSLKYNSYNNSDDYIGIYTDTKAYPAWLKDKTAPSFFVLDKNVYNSTACQNNKPSINEEYKATLLYNSLPKSKDGVYNFIYNSKCEATPYPTDPSTRDPQIYMGVHAADKNPTDQYTDEVKEFDNYIYDNNMVEVVATGDNKNGLMNAKAYAANAITVGFVNAQNQMSPYSAWKNAPYTNASGGIKAQKPEIANYTDFTFYDNVDSTTVVKNYIINGHSSSYYEVVDGSMGATAYTANMLANLIRRQPFLRYHPEAVKARLLTSSVLKISGDNNKSEAVGIPYYPALMGSEFINQPDYEHYTNTTYFWQKDISRMFTKVNEKQYMLKVPFTARPGYKYRVAISWLSYGDDIAKYNRVPQDFDLFLLDSTGTTLTSARNNGATPYEVLNYTPSTENTVYAKILLYDDINSADSPRYHKIKLGMNILEYRDSSYVL